MPKRSEYRQGTPNWVDLQTTDQSAAKKFYTSLFGWGYDDNPVPGGGGVYSMATLNGEAVAAIAPMPPGAPEGMPPIWNTYIAVDDVDAVVDKVVPGGGQVMMPAFDIGDAGRMSFITDPTGAAVGLWQANRHIGATLVNETGTLIWNELLTDKPDLALAFYEAVVGLTHSSMEIAAGQNYRVLKAGDAEVGGCMEPPMPGVPNHWHVYFAVDDADATAAKAAAAGGQVIAEPADIPSVGRFAVLSDPQGAIFSVLKPAPQHHAEWSSPTATCCPTCAQWPWAHNSSTAMSWAAGCPCTMTWGWWAAYSPHSSTVSARYSPRHTGFCMTRWDSSDCSPAPGLPTRSCLTSLWSG